jgi:hypothetical protein
MVAVRIYVEGGGDKAGLRRACRIGFAQLFEKIVPAGHQPLVKACGRRQAAFDDFCTALVAHPDSLCVLLVDSEGPVAVGTTAWSHLKTRDKWKRPSGVKNQQAQMMVQCMEAWFLADKEALKKFYDKGFLLKALPGRANIEEISKDDLFRILEHATRKTTKGAYSKGDHSFQILAKLSPELIENASRHAKTLFDFLRENAADSA